MIPTSCRAVTQGEPFLLHFHLTILIHWRRSISLWSTGKKKPIFNQPLAHGIDELMPQSEHSMPAARWITSLAALRGTDLFASGMLSLLPESPG